METYLKISNINDFIFCPISIYFHNLYGISGFMYQQLPQIEGKQIHKSIENKRYSSRKTILQDMEVFSQKYNICGKIDLYYSELKLLVERKKKIKKIFDGYIFQLYAQYFCMIEMGYQILKMKLYSYDDNRSYIVELPENNNEMFNNFEKIINDINNFEPEKYYPNNSEKCLNCIYEPMCDRALC